MPTKSYYIDHEQKRVLSVHTTPNYRQTTLFLDGTELQVIEGKNNLKQGVEINLDRSNNLVVRLKNHFFEGGLLQLLLNGVPVKGSASDPDKRIFGNFLLILLSGLLTLLTSVYIEFFTIWGGANLPVMQLTALLTGTIVIGIAFAFRSLHFYTILIGLFLLFTNLLHAIVLATASNDIVLIIFALIKALIFAYSFKAIPLARQKAAFKLKSPWLIDQGKKVGQIKQFNQEDHSNYIP